MTKDKNRRRPLPEFATAAKLNELSMRHWDLDDEFEHEVGSFGGYVKFTPASALQNPTPINQHRPTSPPPK
jgi:hypothetical protein